MRITRCDRCNTPILRYRINFNFDVYALHIYDDKGFRKLSGFDIRQCSSRYVVCTKCWSAYIDNGYPKVRSSMLSSGNIELANKFLLDFLGKLG